MDEFTRRRYKKIAGVYYQVLREAGFLEACTYLSKNVDVEHIEEFKKILEDRDA